ncbi:hypothetical protein OF83DRAFT_629859 [Amylostereum chailletii]|nr:hypothetical protein OF83DRAFT_629859 [Amylostereum chailletii]
MRRDTRSRRRVAACFCHLNRHTCKLARREAYRPPPLSTSRPVRHRIHHFQKSARTISLSYAVPSRLHSTTLHAFKCPIWPSPSGDFNPPHRARFRVPPSVLSGYFPSPPHFSSSQKGANAIYPSVATAEGPTALALVLMWPMQNRPPRVISPSLGSPSPPFPPSRRQRQRADAQHNSAVFVFISVALRARCLRRRRHRLVPRTNREQDRPRVRVVSFESCLFVGSSRTCTLCPAVGRGRFDLLYARLPLPSPRLASPHLHRNTTKRSLLLVVASTRLCSTSTILVKNATDKSRFTNRRLEESMAFTRRAACIYLSPMEGPSPFWRSSDNF